MSATLRLLAAVSLLPLPAVAQTGDAPRCMKRDEVVAALSERYKEAPAAVGVQDKNTVIEIFRSRNGESWTILQSFPDGVSCVVAAGTDWMSRDPVELAGILG